MTKRQYDTPIRDERAAQTRDRIVAAGADLVHSFKTWDWQGLTYRAVAERAGVGERTVYRHFPTEEHLHGAVMARLHEESGVVYEGIGLDEVAAVGARVFRTTTGPESIVPVPISPALRAVDVTRRKALLDAVTAAAPDWPEEQRTVAAAMLDMLWGLPSYERLVRAWELSDEQACAAVAWLINQVTEAVGRPEPPDGF